MDPITIVCSHCGSQRVVGEPCYDCKFQPYDERAIGDAEPTSGAPEEAPAAPSAPAPSDDDLDIYPTPPELALAICKRLANRGISPTQILEPSAGDGAFVRAARMLWWPQAEITAIEIRDSCREALRAAGAHRVITTSLESALNVDNCRGDLDYDLVLGNPPFSHAEEHIRLLLSKMRPGAVLAFLLRTGFYESFEQVKFWGEFPEDSFAPIVPRPGFRLNAKGKRGTDSQSYGLFIWIVGGESRRWRDDHLIWRDPSPRRGGRRKKAIETAPMADAKQGEGSGTEIPEVEAPLLE